MNANAFLNTFMVGPILANCQLLQEMALYACVVSPLKFESAKDNAM